MSECDHIWEELEDGSRICFICDTRRPMSNKKLGKTLCEIFAEDSDDRYPNNPGSQGTDTSEAAAVSMSDKAVTLRVEVIEVLTSRGPSTVHEAAAYLEKSVPSIQPRFSELRRMGRISDTGERHLNLSGRPAIVWEATGFLRQTDLFNKAMKT